MTSVTVSSPLGTYSTQVSAAQNGTKKIEVPIEMKFPSKYRFIIIMILGKLVNVLVSLSLYVCYYIYRLALNSDSCLIYILFLFALNLDSNEWSLIEL